MLPSDIREGDHIEIGMLGAYGTAMKTGFNGFGIAQEIVVEDEPMLSLYRDQPAFISQNDNQPAEIGMVSDLSGDR